MRPASIAVFALTLLAAACSKPPPEQRLEPVLKEAKAAYDRQDWKAALRAAEKGLEIKGDDPTLGRIAEHSRARLASVEKRDQEIRKSPALKARLEAAGAVLQELRATLYQRGGDPRGALDRIEGKLGGLEQELRAVEGEGYAEAWGTLGLGWYLAGDVARAEAALLESFVLNPEDGYVHFGLARIYLERALSEPTAAAAWAGKARDYLQRPAKEWSGSAGRDRMLAAAYRAMTEGFGDEAVRLCEDGIRDFQTAEGVEEFWCVLGMVKKGREGIRAYTSALGRRPHYAWVYFMRGSERQLLGEYSEAAGDFDEAIRLNPKLAGAYVNRGMLREDEGEPLERIIQDYEKALEVAPKDWARRQAVERLLKSAREDLKRKR